MFMPAVPDSENYYKVLRIPEPHPPVNPLTEGDIRYHLNRRLNEIGVDTSLINETHKEQERENARRAANQLRDSQAVANLNQRLRQPNNPPRPEAEKKNNKKQIEEYNKQLESSQKDYYNQVGSDLNKTDYTRNLETLTYLIIWLLLRQDAHSPINVTMKLDKDGKPETNWLGNVKRELHFNMGIKLDDFIYSDPNALGGFKFRRDMLSRIGEGLNNMGLYQDKGFVALDEKQYDMIQKEGPRAFSEFMEPYRKAGEVEVDRDNQGNILGVKWKDQQAEQHAMQRIADHMRQYDQQQQQLDQQQQQPQPGNQPPPAPNVPAPAPRRGGGGP